uniref:Uncharacterized protein n=1 Tax=Ditylenchus dipsaci TaxID=166011 RepID=A0A915DW93_9BILA
MMMKTSFAFNLFFIAFHGSYMGIVALGPAYSPSSHTQTQVLTNYGQQEVVRMKLNKQNSLTYPNKFGVSTGSKVGPTTNNAETQYAQTNYAANNPKHIVLTETLSPR